ncbi:MAG: RidA family protein [Candidatus Krumholzibacteriia bacterium]|nr:RidA family protein [bacterium]MCB9512806.1 RidA family protein [Candidatus Latescibacterota bacterium]MCB9516891.1 RidA family protein [Candidatus Latescibacterota bacterium]
MKREILSTGDAPAAIGPYSQAVRAGGFVFTAGQVPLDPATGKLVTGGIEEQTRRVMKNLGAVLAAAGLGFDAVLKTTVYLLDLGEFAVFNGVYGEYFAGIAPPARSTVQVAALPLGARVEIELVAAFPAD